MVERRTAQRWTKACCAAAVAWVILWSVAHGLASPPTALQPKGNEHVAGPSGPPVKKSSLAIELIAKVVRFDQATSVDHYSDGRFASYSATTFEIVSPASLRMRKLIVYHDAPVPQASPLRALDKKVRFRIQEANLDPEIQLFTGALKRIHKWNGTAWAAQTSGTTNFLLGVWGAAANNLWIIGSVGTILHKTQ